MGHRAFKSEKSSTRTHVFIYCMVDCAIYCEGIRTIMMRSLRKQLVKFKRSQAPTPLEKFEAGGYLPWTFGYEVYKWTAIMGAVTSSDTLDLFAKKKQLPHRFGWRIDERIVEYTWLISHMQSEFKHLLDAGSVLNFKPIIQHIHQLERDITIMTLEPELHAYWQLKVSYQYGDLRQIPFRDKWFDEIVSISTLEHIGFDNTFYGADTESEYGDYTQAVDELWRILKTNGTLYITLPYGQADDIIIDGKVFARQFNAEMLERLLSHLKTDNWDIVFYRYTADGWILSEQVDCDDLHYFNIHQQPEYDIDVAAAARAVCCIRAVKSH
jgi:SAM-dependent methyltransferase